LSTLCAIVLRVVLRHFLTGVHSATSLCCSGSTKHLCTSKCYFLVKFTKYNLNMSNKAEASNESMMWFQQVLASLDKAFSKLGFVHADMRISNVMEHHLDAEPMYPKGFTSRKQRKQAVGILTEPKTNTFRIPGALLSHKLKLHIWSQRLHLQAEETGCDNPHCFQHQHLPHFRCISQSQLKLHIWLQPLYMQYKQRKQAVATLIVFSTTTFASQAEAPAQYQTCCDQVKLRADSFQPRAGQGRAGQGRSKDSMSPMCLLGLNPCHPCACCAGQKQGQHVHFKIIDYGHARLSHHRVRRKLPTIPVFEKCYQK